MTTRINEVSLNSIRYPILGQVIPQLASKFAEKQVTGDYTKDSDPYSSSWITSDFRGGMLVEEMDETKQMNRYWWGIGDTRFNAETTLPPLVTGVTIVDLSAGATTFTYPTNMSFEKSATLLAPWTGDGTITTSTPKEGTYSLLHDTSATAQSTSQVCGWDVALKGKTFTFTMWALTSDAHTTVKIGIGDGVGTTYSSTVTGASWQQMTVSRTLNANATGLTLSIVSTPDAPGVGQAAQIDAGNLTSSDMVINSKSAVFCAFNNQLYMGMGNCLSKLNATGDAFASVKANLANTISDLKQDGENLYIFVGEDSYYYYMNKAETVTQTTLNGGRAYYGMYWDSKLFKLDKNGKCFLIGSPATTTPTETASGTMPIADGDGQGAILYRDANGDEIIYGVTKYGLFGHDYANGKFTETSLQYPSQTTAGLGQTVWKDSLYISAGQTLFKYTIASYAEIDQVGLDLDDGLPALYSGQITKLIPAFDCIYALVDGVYEGATSVSQVIAYDGVGWRTIYITAANKHIYSGIVSSIYAQRLWFADDAGVHYIPLNTSSLKPKKTASYNYAASGTIITPWFDADWCVGNKMAYKFSVSCRDMTATETIIVKYRINHATTAVASTWTTLGTIVASGLTSYTFGSSLGLQFREIQFRFDLARGSTTTLSPVLEYAHLIYEKILPKRWSWQFTIDCTKSYGGYAPDTLLDRVITAAETETLVPFSFDETTYYVRIYDVKGERLTGVGRQGTYQVLVIEPI